MAFRSAPRTTARNVFMIPVSRDSAATDRRRGGIIRFSPDAPAEPEAVVGDQTIDRPGERTLRVAAHLGTHAERRAPANSVLPAGESGFDGRSSHRPWHAGVRQDAMQKPASIGSWPSVTPQTLRVNSAPSSFTTPSCRAHGWTRKTDRSGRRPAAWRATPRCRRLPPRSAARLRCPCRCDTSRARPS